MTLASYVIQQAVDDEDPMLHSQQEMKHTCDLAIVCEGVKVLQGKPYGKCTPAASPAAQLSG